MLNVSWTLTLLAMLASLAVAAPAAATPEAPAQEEYILELPNAGNGGGGVNRGDNGEARSRTPDALGTLTADAGDDGSALLVIVLAATALAGVSIAVVKAVK